MRGRLIFAIVSTMLEEAAISVILLFGLPSIGVKIPLPAVIVIMLAWLGWAVFTYRMGSRALRRRPLISLGDMAGSTGVAVKPLNPEGMVRIKGELWVAHSAGERIEAGAEVVVVTQDGLRLAVRATDSGQNGSGAVDKGDNNQRYPANGQPEA